MSDKYYQILQRSEIFFQNYAQRSLSGGLEDRPATSIDQNQRRKNNEEQTKREEAEKVVVEERLKREETERILEEERGRREQAERAVEEERARRESAEEKLARFEALEAQRQKRKSSRVKKFFSKFTKNK